MTFPVQCERVYVNPDGNVVASGYYRSGKTQYLANMLPPWMHIRQNPNSVGQQFISSPAVHLSRLERNLNDSMRSAFLKTADVDEVDVLYRTKLPNNVNLTEAQMGIRCIAAPSGCSPSGVEQIELKEVTSVDEFYYNCIPTRIEVTASGAFEEIQFRTTPSGIPDTEEKKYDVWGKKHDLTWCLSGGLIRKQDKETMEDYETYTEDRYGISAHIDYLDGIIWCVSNDGADKYVKAISSKTFSPKKERLDLIAAFDVTASVSSDLASVYADDSSNIYVKGSDGEVYLMHPRYDYYLLDKDSRQVYMLEDYTDSGVFISNT